MLSGFGIREDDFAEVWPSSSAALAGPTGGVLVHGHSLAHGHIRYPRAYRYNFAAEFVTEDYSWLCCVAGWNLEDVEIAATDADRKDTQNYIVRPCKHRNRSLNEREAPSSLKLYRLHNIRDAILRGGHSTSVEKRAVHGSETNFGPADTLADRGGTVIHRTYSISVSLHPRGHPPWPNGTSLKAGSASRER